MLGLGCFDKHDVGSCTGIPVRPFDRLVQSQRGTCVGSGDDEHVVVQTGVDCSMECLFEHRSIDKLLIGQVAAPFREGLVLQLDGRHPSGVVLADGTDNVRHRPVAGVGVGDERYIAEHSDYHSCPFGHLSLGNQAEVGQSESRGCHASAGQVGT